MLDCHQFPLVENCFVDTIDKVYKKYEKTDADIIAIKCESAEDFIPEDRVLKETRKKTLDYFIDNRKEI